MTKLEEVKKIAIIGGGIMGHGCAMVFAGAGYEVGLWPEGRDAGEGSRGMPATLLAERGLGKLEDVGAWPLCDHSEMEEASADADLCSNAWPRHGAQTGHLPEARPDVQTG
jgi:3-hydroxyacyl-CoA dehydrogenase